MSGIKYCIKSIVGPSGVPVLSLDALVAILYKKTRLSSEENVLLAFKVHFHAEKPKVIDCLWFEKSIQEYL